MNITCIDEAIFGVDNLEACAQYLIDFGLKPFDIANGGTRFEALDGTAVIIYAKDNPCLPPPLPTGTMLRKTTYGVPDQATLDEIKAELEKDRDVKILDDGALESVDDAGFILGFQISIKKDLNLIPELVNSPGAPDQRGMNVIGANQDAAALPITFSHIVYFVPDGEVAENFYIERLKFVLTDRFRNGGPFLRPAGCRDHHTLFMIQTPDYMKGVEHLAFHMQGPTDLMLAGSRFVAKGYESFWGPGRHKFGSNWFWYFNSPLGTHFEYDADMDLHDDDWVPREADLIAEESQIFLFENKPKWSPGPSEED